VQLRAVTLHVLESADAALNPNDSQVALQQDQLLEHPELLPELWSEVLQTAFAAEL
jgi:hypothetical protein